MATATAPQTVAGHPMAMKVGGRRLSVSKSPPVKSYLSTSPSATKDTTTTEEATDYPRPEGGETKKEGSNEESKHKKDEEKAKKDKPVFDDVKQKIHNNNLNSNNHFNLKQPAGKA